MKVIIPSTLASGISNKRHGANDQGFEESLLMHSGMYLPEDHQDVVNAKIEFDPIDKFLWARMRYSASFNDASNNDTFEPGGYLTDYWTNESVKVLKPTGIALSFFTWRTGAYTASATRGLRGRW